jgi:hypothetical protein
MSTEREFTWKGDEFLELTLKAADVGIAQAAEVVVGQAKANLSQQGTNKTYVRLARRGEKILSRAESIRLATPSRADRRVLNSLSESNRIRFYSRFVKLNNSKADRLIKKNQKAVDAARYFRDRGEVDAAGGFPRLRTGFLRRSIKSGHIGIPVRGERWVGSTMDPVTGYAAAQEFGSPKLKLPARPYIRPAFDSTVSAQADAFIAGAGSILEAGSTP